MTSRKHRAFVQDARQHYDAMLEAQGGHCALCPSTPKTRRLHIDHDHRQMRVRGLLCFRCNSLLRTWVTPEWLRAAAAYLDRKGTWANEEAA
jgi:hypothetical protein